MYQTIEALYKNGRIIPILEKMPTKESRVLITILEGETHAAATRQTISPSQQIKVMHCGGKLRDFSRDDGYDDRI